jgi:pimeloyl-ACP methyl ester carboxylesterase
VDANQPGKTTAVIVERVSAEIRYAKSGGVHIAYQVLGEGPPDIVHVPGWATHLKLAWSFPSYAHLLNRLASFSRADRVGQARNRPLGPRDHAPTLQERMDDLAAVMDAAGSERAVFAA